MEKPVAAIELCSKCVKIVIGYVLDGKVHVLYTLTKEVGPIINRGNVIDPVALKGAIEAVSMIDDASAKLKINVSDALLAIPPYGVEVYQTKPVVTIISEDGKVSEFDIRNVYTLVRKAALPQNMQLVDIIPANFVLDQGRSFSYPPLGQSSSSLQIFTRIHALPKNIYNNYVSSLEGAGVEVRRSMIASGAAVELLASYGDEYPNDYFLVDIGSDMTTVSLVGYRQLFSSRFFSWGGDEITRAIVEQFDVDPSEAEKIKMLYGFDDRQLTFDPIVSTSEEGIATKHTVKQLNEIMQSQLENFSKELNNALNSLLETYAENDKYRSLPMVLIGGGSQLHGLKKFLQSKMNNTNIIIPTPKSLGARNSSYFNCLGMILMNYKYPNAYDDNQKKVTDLSRDPRVEEKK
ncbi:MAG: rod shape-determining protein [Bacilli bacterium]|nr:rod shape-determining protein [Bacilli bacterium]